MDRLQKTNALQERAMKSMPLGVNSNGRFWGKGCTPYFSRGKGSHMWDVDGNEYIDYRLGFGPVILGYAYDEVDNAVIEALHSGVTPGITCEREVEVAEAVINMCPAVEMVRLVNTGSEATMNAIRVARAYTRREKIIKLEGGYHGGYDYVLYSTYAPPTAYGNRRDPIKIPASSGIPRALDDLIIPIPFNDPEVLELTLKRYGHEVAAIITEPMLGNFGLADPKPGYMDFLRKKCDEYGILWILDEVKTGFRVAKGGAQERYGYRPDLSTFAKSIGNGFPIAAYGGRKEVMDIVGKGVTQGGTYAGNGVGTAAAKATLHIMQTQDVHKHIDAMGTRLQKGLAQVFSEAGIPCLISSLPSIFSLTFCLEKNEDARDWGKADSGLYKKLAAKVFEKGVLIDEDPREPFCLCYSHSEADIDFTIEAFRQAVKEL